MAIYRYKKDFVKEVIDCKTEKLTSLIEARYCLSLDLNNGLDSSYAVVMLNPSKANKEISDLTIDKLARFSHSMNEAGTLHIVNLFPFYEPKSENLASIIKNLRIADEELYNQAMDLNGQIIESFVKGAKKVILAWGDCPDSFSKLLYDQELKKIGELLKQLNYKETYAIKTQFERLLTVKNSPRHPSRPSLISLEPYSLQS
ncbi:DUF1643 domain-containing protein [Bacillus paralicheniformis]|uniref:DUF1643 domain-containing protein n=1 Tax=Bacillus paralicheniformis TaxID=1648923 RepID=UPI003637D1E5